MSSRKYSEPEYLGTKLFEIASELDRIRDSHLEHENQAITLANRTATLALNKLTSQMDKQYLDSPKKIRDALTLYLEILRNDKEIAINNQTADKYKSIHLQLNQYGVNAYLLLKKAGEFGLFLIIAASLFSGVLMFNTQPIAHLGGVIDKQIVTLLGSPSFTVNVIGYAMSFILYISFVLIWCLPTALITIIIIFIYPKAINYRSAMLDVIRRLTSSFK